MLLCTGGCRSGKSDFALKWVEAQAAKRVYVATADATEDMELLHRIARHRGVRGEGWATFETASGPWADPEALVKGAVAEGDAILFDCLTLWASLCLHKGLGEQEILALADRLFNALGNCGKPVAMVTNEIGMGLVPGNALGRQFRDIAGLVNQRAAAAADTVVFMVSGLPLYVKGEQLSL